MAYNKKNYYKKIIEVQELTLDKTHRKTMTYKEVYWQYIEPRYHICYKTFSTYLGVPAKRELEKIKQSEKEQLKLF